MKRVINHWKWIPVISLILSIIGCAHQPAQSQTQMMDADLEPRPMLEKAGVASKQMSLPHEPLLFEMAKDLPPSAMLRDQDELIVPHATQSLEAAEKPRPSAMPSEPKPR